MGTPIVLATGIQKLEETIANKFRGYFKNVDAVGSVRTKKELLELIHFSKKQPADIILFSESLKGPEQTLEVLQQIKYKYPNIRVIYLGLPVSNNDTSRLTLLGRLVMIGIYDIWLESSFTLDNVQHAINYSKKYEEVSFYTQNVPEVIKSVNEVQSNIKIEKSEPRKNTNNIFSFSSIKPGQGKSFLVANIATGIAKFGIPINGKQPTVALIEGDLQNLSVGSLLAMDWNDKYNLQTVLQEISTVLNEKGQPVNNPAAHKKVREFIIKALMPYKHCPNLFVLNGSECNVEWLNERSYTEHYLYLLDTVRQYFDVVIVDTNSSLYHSTTLPILSLSEKCYYILEADYNIVLNNQNYLSLLKQYNLLKKIKFIINQDINKYNMSNEGGVYETLKFTSDDLNGTPFETKLRIPKVPTVIMKNRTTDGIPLVLDVEVEHTRRAQCALLEVADDVWKVKGLMNLHMAIQKEENNKKRLFGRKGL